MGRNKDEYQLNGLLDRGCSFEGKLTFDGTVQINGDFRGEILSDGTLVVGSEAHINARVQVDTLIVDGSIQGIVEAKRKIELHRGSRLMADIVSPALVIEEGAVFQGQSRMLEEAQDSTSARPGEGLGSNEGEPIYADEGEDSLMM
ncbi:MAG TPA: polymer-forming cytoskeletal protein [bacterium]|nr:polymer-forming cytoskeletal protein [bacterium]